MFVAESDIFDFLMVKLQRHNNAHWRSAKFEMPDVFLSNILNVMLHKM